MRCVNDPNQGSVLFRGRWLCFSCYEKVRDKLSKLLNDKEIRENRILPDEEVVAVIQQKTMRDVSGRAIRIRGARFTITREELDRFAKENKAP